MRTSDASLHAAAGGAGAVPRRPGRRMRGRETAAEALAPAVAAVEGPLLIDLTRTDGVTYDDSPRSASTPP